ncbi:MAG TPA: PRC-barrel domain-containing protein, partial [Alphaproteobacteria bacterium]|nr:PRC-barrel domain-containing protein [Alphaproteobacteria bacterium]
TVAMLGATGLAMAQQATTTAAPSDATSELRAIDDLRIVGPNGEDIGEIEEVLIDASGQVVAVSVEAGGFLDVGDKDVIMQLDQLQIQGERITTNLTRQEIEALPEWDD